MSSTGGMVDTTTLDRATQPPRRTVTVRGRRIDAVPFPLLSDRYPEDPRMDSTRGKLLVAAPSLVDPNFRQTVLLMLEHNDQGALGVVLNRPSELSVTSAIDDWADAVSSPPVVFVGGPVSQSSVIALASVALDDADDTWSQVVGRIGTVDLEREPGEVGGLDEVRIFAGYAAWAPGQLEAELAEDAWFVLGLDGSDPFSDDPDELWWRVFARQEGDLRRLRLYPRNPSDN